MVNAKGSRVLFLLGAMKVSLIPFLLLFVGKKITKFKKQNFKSPELPVKCDKATGVLYKAQLEKGK